MTDSHVGRREKTGPSLILPGHILAVPNVTPCAKTAAFHRTRHNTMTGESAPLLEPREGADAPSRRGRIVRVAAAGLLAAGAVVAVAGGSSRDAVALLRSPATLTTMPSVSHHEARLGDGRWEEIEEAKRLMMAQERELRSKLKELRDHIVKNADNVGERFPNEARKMHYGDIEHRPIYGEASPEEARALVDEGVEVSPLPTLPEDRN